MAVFDGSDLKEWRKARKVTAAELASKISVDESTIFRYESGKQTPDPDTITNALVAAVACTQKANSGDARAFAKILEITRQDPRVLLEQEKLDLERKSLEQGASGYAALDAAFAGMGNGSDEP